MKKIEILSPAGNYECLESAIKGGCDAVYIGGVSFGARKFAKNFANEEIEKAVKLCHLFGVKLYVTVNTIIYNEEIEEVTKYVRFLHKIGVDALIVQDIGLMNLIHHKFPNMEIHSSTQSHNVDDYSLSAMKELGCTRCVLARELTIDEIRALKTDIEKEVFIHGALCISYSGECLFSALNGNRSGNRGECTGSCRLPYNLYKDDKLIFRNKYLLSTKSLCTLPKLGEILDSNVDSLKIEGRMKSKEYTSYVSKVYKDYVNGNKEVSNNSIENLKKLYSREFTLGNIFSDKLMNINTSNHIGIIIGKVISADSRKVKISLDKELNLGDGIRFGNNEGFIVNKLYDKDGKLVSSISSGICFIDNKVNIKEKDIVRKTLDSKLIKEIDSYEYPKIPVKITAKAFVGDKLFVSISDSNYYFETYGNVIEEALKSPTTKDRIESQLLKLGDTPFIGTSIVDTDNKSFVPIQEINELRREVTNKLIEARENKKIEFIENNYDISLGSSDTSLNINVLIRNEEQLLEVLKYKVNYVYVTDYDLYIKYKHLGHIYYVTDRVKEKHVFNNDNLLCTSLSMVYKYRNSNNIISDSYLNVVNSYSVNYLKSLGVKLVTLSYEIYNNEIPLGDTELIIYGTPTLMIIKNDIIENYDSKSKYYLENIKGNKFRVIKSENYTSVYHCKKVNYLDDLNKYKNRGISNFRIEFFDEDAATIEKIMEKIYG